MADFVFNQAKGRAVELVTGDLTRLGVLLLTAAESDGLMRDRLTIADLLTGSTEATFTNYTRQVYTATITMDLSANRTSIDIQNPTWVTAGGSVNNPLVKLVTYFDDAGGDSFRTPITAHDFVGITNGSTIVAELYPDGFYRAA